MRERLCHPTCAIPYLSVCSGIEAATVAWHPLGFRPLAFSEIEPFARAVLAHHYPNVPLHGDFTLLRDEDWIAGADTDLELERNDSTWTYIRRF